MKWIPIEQAPKDTRTMFVVKGFNVKLKSGIQYTTDPYCVWRRDDGEFIRWPHAFPPTHFCFLPVDPE